MSGYRLYQGPRLESFPEDHPELFLQDHPLSEPVTIVVQNAGLGEWLARALAERKGAVMGLRVMMPEQALRHFAAHFPTARRLLTRSGADPGGRFGRLPPTERRGLLFMDGMKAALYKVLEEVLGSGDEVYEPLRSYAAGGGVRRWQLADAIAGLFYHYGMNCLPLVEAWDAGRPFAAAARDGGVRSAEAWQRGLWRRLFHDGAPYTHLSRVLSETMAVPDETYDGPPGRIVLFGSMFLGETGLKFFRHLAGTLDVHHFLFTPSRAFAGKPPKDASPDSRETGPIQGDLFAVEENLPPPALAGTAFLMENGRLAADFASFIPSLNADERFWLRGFPDVADGSAVSNGRGSTQSEGAPTVLDRLRAALVADEPFRGSVEDDGSLAVHDVTGIRREVEVLKDRILEALREDDALAPTDIGVLAPDIGRYASVIETVFPGPGTGDFYEPDHLPFNLSDLPARGDSPYPAAFAALMGLPGSRFGRSSLVDLFSNPCFAPTARDDDAPDAWRRIAESLHVRWGADAAHRGRAGAADLRTGSWDTAFERLLAGYYHDDGDDPSLTPAELSGDTEADSAGRLMRSLRGLFDELGRMDADRLSLREWTLRWERIADAWLSPRRDAHAEEDESDRLRIKGAIRDLTALCDDLDDLSDFADDRLPWDAFSSLLEETIRPSGGRRGRYLARGVTCSSLKPMRAIPFRRIYILGLGEGAWPGREYLAGFDLRNHVEKTIDLSRESVDRFAFLEALFSASDHISFFYSGRDAERGDAIAPAVPLAELLEYLGPEAKGLVRTHPLVPYDPRALGGEAALATSSRKALELAESRFRESPAVENLRIAPPRLEGGGIPDGETLDWRTLLGFLKNPIQFYYRDRVGASAEIAAADLDDDDILEADFLDWWGWRNDIVRHHPEDLEDGRRILDSFRKYLNRAGIVSSTSLETLGDGRRLEQTAAMADQYRRIRSEGFEPEEPFSILLDPTIDAPVPGTPLRLPALRLFPGGSGSVVVTGLVDGFRHLYPDGMLDARTWTRLDFVNGDRLKPKHDLESWLASLLAVAAGGTESPLEVRAFRIGGHDFQARRYYARAADRPIAAGGDRRILESPVERLTSLAELLRQGEREPLALHPQLADALGRTDAKSPLGDSVSEAAAGAWNRILSDTLTPHSDLRDCPYRRRFLPEPNFGSRGFLGMWELYRDGGIL